MGKITKKILETEVTKINKIKGFDNPKLGTAGTFALGWAYGGVRLHRYVSENRAIEDVFSSGYISKRDLFYRLCAYQTGLTDLSWINPK